MQYLSFYDWRISFCVMSSGFINVDTYSRIYFLRLSSVPLYMYTFSLLICHGHLGSLATSLIGGYDPMIMSVLGQEQHCHF